MFCHTLILFNKIIKTMKKFFFLAVICLLAASSCSNESEDRVLNEQTVAPVTVHASGFEVTQGDFSGTRATEVGSSSIVKALTLAFYKVSDGTEVYKHTQFKNTSSTYTSFGEFSCYLPIGNYTMVLLGYGQGNTDQEITLTSPTAATYGEGRMRDTFAATASVEITDGSAVNLTATLNRIVAALAVKSTDNRPAEVTYIRFTYSQGGKAFNPTSGLATSNTGFASVMDYSGSPGVTTNIGSYLFLATDEQTMNVTIETLDADQNVLVSKTVNNVPLKRNRVTTLTGAIYSASTSVGSIQVNSDWLTGNNIDF